MIVNRANLAEAFGVSLPTVDGWIRSGCPVIQRGGKGIAWQFDTSDVYQWRMDRAREEAAGPETTDEKEIKRRTAAAKMAQAELDLAKAKGEVAPLDQVQRAMGKAFAEVKANIRNVPGRVVSVLIGETDEVRFKKVLLAEIDQALEALADAQLVDDEDLDAD